MSEKISHIVIFENGKFCWRKEVREKTIEDYKKQLRGARLIILAIFIATYLF